MILNKLLNVDQYQFVMNAKIANTMIMFKKYVWYVIKIIFYIMEIVMINALKEPVLYLKLINLNIFIIIANNSLDTC